MVTVTKVLGETEIKEIEHYLDLIDAYTIYIRQIIQRSKGGYECLTQRYQD
jgi:hypothetical protein